MVSRSEVERLRGSVVFLSKLVNRGAEVEILLSNAVDLMQDLLLALEISGFAPVAALHLREQISAAQRHLDS